MQMIDDKKVHGQKEEQFSIFNYFHYLCSLILIIYRNESF